MFSKPVIYAANISEFDMGKNEDTLPLVNEVKNYARKEGSEVLVICAKKFSSLSRKAYSNAASLLAPPRATFLILS